MTPPLAPFPYESHTLPNGLRLITLADHDAPLAAVQLWFHTGSRHEDPRRRGFAHMFEHMMFRGTERLGPKDHFQLIQRTGGECNAYTSFDQTVYVEEVPANQLELVFWLESERMAFLRIDTDGFRTERDVVAEEYRVHAEAPYGTIAERLLPRLFPGHPYQWTPIGSMEELGRATVEELQQFWERHYVPANATLVVTGDIDPARVRALAERYFGWIPAGTPPPPPPRIDPPKGPLRFRIKEPNGPAPVVALAWRTVPSGHADALPLEWIASILGGGESSRLYRALVVDERRAMVSLASSIHLELDGLLVAAAVLRPFQRGRRRALTAVRAEVERLLRDGPSAQELEKARNNALRDAVLRRIGASNQAQVLGEAALIDGNLGAVNEEWERIRALGREELIAVARRNLVPGNEVAVEIRPSPIRFFWHRLTRGHWRRRAFPPAHAHAASEPASHAMRRRALARPTGLPERPPVAAPLAPRRLPALEEARLSNGLRVAVIPRASYPYVAFHLGVRRGAASDPERTPGCASMALAMLTSGTVKRDYRVLTTEIDHHAITIETDCGMDACSISAGTVSDGAERALTLLAELVRSPVFPQERLETLREQAHTAKSVAEKSPAWVADRELRRRLYGAHPYARSPEAELAELPGLEAPALRGWWQGHVEPANAILYVAGDLGTARAVALAERSFGDWSGGAGERAPAYPPAPVGDALRIYLVDRAGDQAQVRAAHVGIPWRDARITPAFVLSHVFGGSFQSRLNAALRVEKGLTYGVRGGFHPQVEAGEFAMSTFTRVPRAADTVAALIAETRRLGSEPPTAEEVAAACSYLSGSYWLERETPDALIADHWLIEYAGLPRDHFARYLRDLAAMKPEDLPPVIADLVHPDRLAIVVLGPARRLRAPLESIAPVTVVR